MKSAKRWTTTGAATCALCRESFPAATAGLMCDFGAAVENTTIVKFVCMGCAGPITTAVAGEEIIRRSQIDRGQEVMLEQMAQAARRSGGRS